MVKKMMLAVVAGAAIATYATVGSTPAAHAAIGERNCTPGQWHNDYECCPDPIGGGTSWYQGGCNPHTGPTARSARLSTLDAARDEL
jgi:hypothetical protein